MQAKEITMQRNAMAVERKRLAAVTHKMVMVGMHLTKTRGGITTLINDLLGSELSKNFEITYIESQAEEAGKFGKYMIAASAFAKFTKEIAAKDCRMAYVHIGCSASLYRESIFIRIAKKFNKKVVAHFHAGDVEEYLSGQGAKHAGFVKKSLEMCDEIIAVSRDSQEKLARIAPEARVTLIPNALNTKGLKFPVKRLMNRSATGYVRLLFVGAMGKLKGEKDLANAIKRLSRTFPNIRATFLGYGGEEFGQHCKNLGIQDLIEFIGPVDKTQRGKYYQNADIFVLPTYAEAMPMSIIEAMVAGLPIISTNVGGIPELIDDCTEGFLIQPGKVGDLVKSLEMLIKQKALRVDFATRVQEKIESQMNFDGYVREVSGVLRRIAN